MWRFNSFAPSGDPALEVQLAYLNNHNARQKQRYCYTVFDSTEYKFDFTE